MTEASRTSKWRKRLETLRHELDAEEVKGADDRKTVMLDQQAVGRLSRMDALQRQAMAAATQRRRNAQRERIRAALARLEEGEFGYCDDCGEEIPEARLELDPTITLCMSCARG